MAFAIGYVRSLPGLEEGEPDVDAQVALILQFAKDDGYTIKHIFREELSGGGKFTKVRPKLVSAIYEAKRERVPIVVAKFTYIACEFSRERVDALTAKTGVSLISADSGERLIDEGSLERATRRKHIRETKSKSSKEAADRRGRMGLPLGNTRNLSVAQQKGSATVKAAAALRLREFLTLQTKAKREGSRTAKELAAWLNSHGRKTAQGLEWTPYNVDQMRRKLRARTASPAGPAGSSKPAKPAIYDADRLLTTDGQARVQHMMKAKRFKWGKTGKLMTAMGFSRYDVSIVPALMRVKRLKEEHANALQKYVEQVEEEFGL